MQIFNSNLTTCEIVNSNSKLSNEFNMAGPSSGIYWKNILQKLQFSQPGSYVIYFLDLSVSLYVAGQLYNCCWFQYISSALDSMSAKDD